MENFHFINNLNIRLYNSYKQALKCEFQRMKGVKLDVFKNILGALCVVLCGMAILAVIVGIFLTLCGFCIWFFMCAIPKFIFDIIRIIAIIIVIGIVTVGFYGAYQMVDDYRCNR